jgi:hypothetical protein
LAEHIASEDDEKAASFKKDAWKMAEHRSKGNDYEEPFEQRMVRKFGPQPWNGASKFSDLEPRDRKKVEDFLKRHDLKGRGGRVGIEFHPARMGSSTLDSHRVVRWASRQDKSEELYSVLNHQHFILGKKLNDREMLADACQEVGLDR